MLFTGTVGKSDSGPVRPGVDGEFDAVNVNGDAECRWSASVNVNWIDLEQSSGTLPAGDVQESVQFRINDRARELTVGHHLAIISFRIGSGEIYGPESLYIDLRVLEPCRFDVEASYLHYKMKQGQVANSIEPQRIVIKNGDHAGDCRWELDPGVQWLSIEPSSGILKAGVKQILQATVNDGANTLPPRDGHGTTIRFMGELINKSIGAQLDIEPPPCHLQLDTTKPEFVVSGPEGGPFEPSTINLVLKNAGGEPCNWHTTPGEWTDITPNSGAIPPASGTPIEITVSESTLHKPPGKYEEAVTFNAGEGAASSNAITVFLNVAELPCLFSAGVGDTLDFKRQPNGQFVPQSRSIEIANAAHRLPCQWMATGPQWLTFTPVGGELGPGSKEIVRLEVHPEHTEILAQQQTHRGAIRFVVPTGSADESDMPVSLELNCLEDEPCIDLHSTRESIVFGENAELSLSMSNPLSLDAVTVNLELTIPVGWSLTPGDYNANCDSGRCSSNHLIGPGEKDDIQILASPNAPSSEERTSTFKGRVEWFHGDRRDATVNYELVFPITVAAAPAQIILDFRQNTLATPVPEASLPAAPVPSTTPVVYPPSPLSADDFNSVQAPVWQRPWFWPVIVVSVIASLLLLVLFVLFMRWFAREIGRSIVQSARQQNQLPNQPDPARPLEPGPHPPPR